MTESVIFRIEFDKFGPSQKINLNPGLHVVYGESGCGKSKIIKSLAGLIENSFDHIKLIKYHLPNDVQIVFQNPENQIISHTLESELSFGLECQSVDLSFLQIELKKLKSELDFIDNWMRHPSTLSGGEMEMLNLITAISTNPKLLLIDDGLSFLDENTKSNWVNKVRKKLLPNKTLIWFTSDQSDIQFGQTKWTLSLSGIEPIEEKSHQFKYSFDTSDGDLELKIDKLCFSHGNEARPLMENWNCNITKSRILGITGKNGKGKTTLSQLITGFLNPKSGQINISIRGKSATSATLDQFPERMLGPDTLETFISNLIFHKKMNQRLLKKCINRLNSYQINWLIIKNQPALDVSWSTLRMALIIILAHCEYDILILDEPTFGLGQEQKLNLSMFFKEIIKQKHLILISHDSSFIDAHCDHIYNIDTQNITKNSFISLNAKKD